MSDAARGASLEHEAPVNPYTLLGAVNDSSNTAHTAWLIFIGIISYLLVAVAGVSHKDLLLSRDIQLPILQVGIELTRFFLFAPVLLVLFHVGVITQLVMLARKTLELDSALRILEATDRRTHPLRLELNNFFFVQAIAGPERSRTVNGLLHGMTWLTLVVLPVLLLLYIQVTFLPYHDVTITWAHRIALLADFGLLALIGVFLSRPEQSLATAFQRSMFAHPITSLTTAVVFGVVAMFSFLVATVPDEHLDLIGRGLLPVTGKPATAGASPATFGFALPFIGATADGRLFGVFERNLNVTDHDLVIDRNVTPGEPTLILRRRDLRHARLDRTDLHQADMTGANLDGASLVGADLRGVAIHCADVGLLLLSGDRRAAACPSARGANLTNARLADANLAGLDLRGADLGVADLTGANLAHADLAGANLYNARLERADLSGGAAMQGANLATASLQGADLTGANLQGADLANASLQGAVLEFANLHGASLRDADLEGANLYQVRLLGADRTGANIRAASLREAWVWRALPPSKASAGLADLEGLRESAPENSEIEALDALLKRMADANLEQRLRERLAGVLKPGEGAASPQTWSEIAAAARSVEFEPRVAVVTGSVSTTNAVVTTGLGSLPETIGTGGSTPSVVTGQPLQNRNSDDRSARLTRYLASLACKTRWANGSVAAGLAKRAHSVAFNGDMGGLYERLKSPECPAAKTMPDVVIRRLADSVERLRGN